MTTPHSRQCFEKSPDTIVSLDRQFSPVLLRLPPRICVERSPRFELSRCLSDIGAGIPRSLRVTSRASAAVSKSNSMPWLFLYRTLENDLHGTAELADVRRTRRHAIMNELTRCSFYERTAARRKQKDGAPQNSALYALLPTTIYALPFPCQIHIFLVLTTALANPVSRNSCSSSTSTDLLSIGIRDSVPKHYSLLCRKHRAVI